MTLTMTVPSDVLRAFPCGVDETNSEKKGFFSLQVHEGDDDLKLPQLGRPVQGRKLHAAKWSTAWWAYRSSFGFTKAHQLSFKGTALSRSRAHNSKRMKHLGKHQASDLGLWFMCLEKDLDDACHFPRADFWFCSESISKARERGYDIKTQHEGRFTGRTVTYQGKNYAVINDGKSDKLTPIPSSFNATVSSSQWVKPGDLIGVAKLPSTDFAVKTLWAKSHCFWYSPSILLVPAWLVGLTPSKSEPIWDLTDVDFSASYDAGSDLIRCQDTSARSSDSLSWLTRMQMPTLYGK